MQFYKKILIFFLFALFVLVGVGYYSGEKLYDFPGEDYPTLSYHDSADVILCLSGGAGRFHRAVELWRELKNTSPDVVLYVAGMGPRSTFQDFVRQIPDSLLPFVNESKVILEKESTTTRENIDFFKLRMKEYQWKKVVLVTSSYHMKRAYAYLKRSLPQNSEIYIDPVYSETFNSSGWYSSLDGIQVTMGEALKGFVGKVY